MISGRKHSRIRGPMVAVVQRRTDGFDVLACGHKLRNDASWNWTRRHCAECRKGSARP